MDLTNTSLAGVARETLLQWLRDAQEAKHQLLLGKKTVALSYSQGDGSKSVSFTQANIGDLTQYIASLQAQLGLTKGRRPIRFRF